MAESRFIAAHPSLDATNAIKADMAGALIDGQLLTEDIPLFRVRL
jgi:hypothetical protein